MKMTHGLDDGAVQGLAWRTFAISVLAVGAAGVVGTALLDKWNVQPFALALAGGLVFAIVGLRQVLAQYEEGPSGPPTPLPAKPIAAALRIAFPTVVTPYGIAALIVLLANSTQSSRAMAIYVLAFVMLVLDLLAMLFARRIMGGVTVLVLQIVGAVLGVMQVAFAIEIVVDSLRLLGVIGR
jgi:multiple antibiotic resistance protein